jgi:ketosteroid isomerase-like protein
MKRVLCGFVAACVMTVSVFAADGTATAAVEKELLALTREWADAEIKRDAPTMQRIMDDRFIATFGAGQPVTRADYIKAVVEDPDTMLSQALTDETIVDDGDTAVLVGTVDIRSSSQGKETTTRHRYTATYIKRSGGWVALALHMVKAR